MSNLSGVKRWLPFVMAALLAALLAFSLYRSADPTYKDVPSPLIGKAVPNFSSEDLFSAAPVTSQQLLGRPYILNVWGSWCPTCHLEHPVFNRYRQSADALPIIGLNYKDRDEDAKRWLAQLGNPYKMVIADRDGSIGLDLGVYGAPETYFVDARGIIRFKKIGELTAEELNREAERLRSYSGAQSS